MVSEIYIFLKVFNVIKMYIKNGLYSSSSCCFHARFMSAKKLFANKLVEGLGTIFGWVHISHTLAFLA